MRGVHPADKAHRLIDEAEFELDSIKELMAQCKALDRTGAPKPPPLPEGHPVEWKDAGICASPGTVARGA